MTSSSKSDFMEHLLEMLEEWGPAQARPMFGGFGVFRDGLMFGLVSSGTFYLKTDDVNRGDFLARDLPPFTYRSRGKVAVMSYYRAPEEVLEDPDEMGHWARKAYEAALRGRKR